MSVVEFAKSELERLVENNDEMQIIMNNNIIEVLEVLSKQGHTGFSINYLMGTLNRLVDFKPISPLTGEDDEWNDVSEMCGSNTQQNKRCPAVFRNDNDNSTARYQEGKVFTEDGGETWFTSSDSSIPITFPFVVPDKPEYVYLNPSESDEAESTETPELEPKCDKNFDIVGE